VGLAAAVGDHPRVAVADLELFYLERVREELPRLARGRT